MLNNLYFNSGVFTNYRPVISIIKDTTKTLV